MNQNTEGSYSRLMARRPQGGGSANRKVSLLCACAVALWTASGGACAAPIPSALQSPVFVAFDLETTGLSASRDRIVEIAAVKIRHGTIVDRRQWLVNPGQPIPPAATRIHGLTDVDVKDAPAFETVYPAFLEFINGSILVAHNAPFDIRFIVQAAQRNALTISPEPVLDTLRLARKLFPEQKQHDLPTLARQFGIDTGRSHRALDDSLTLATVFTRTLKTLPATTTLADLFHIVGGPLHIQRTGSLDGATAQPSR